MGGYFKILEGLLKILKSNSINSIETYEGQGCIKKEEKHFKSLKDKLKSLKAISKIRGKFQKNILKCESALKEEEGQFQNDNVEFKYMSIV